MIFLITYYKYDLNHLFQTKKKLKYLFPFLVALLIFFIYIFFALPLIPGTREEKGQFGDSFGVLNTLFTGLGFAGLTVTIKLQLDQIRQNQKELIQNLHDASISKYEETLFRLLDLYKSSTDSLILNDSGKTINGINVLKHSCEHLNSRIKKDEGNEITPDCLERYKSNNLTNDDKMYLDEIFQINFRNINFSLNRQTRVIESFKALLRHLEQQGPSEMNRDEYRRIINSQITYIEATYFFFISLGIKSESELRQLLLSSTLCNKFYTIKKTKVQKIIYKEYWGLDIDSLNTNERELPKRIYTGKTNKNSSPYQEKNAKVPYIIKIQNFFQKLS